MTRLFHENEISEAAALIKQGELVAFPTETVYGLGADGLNPHAVAKIFTAKGRPQDNPLILHVASLDQVRSIAVCNYKSLRLMHEFWPGPLTLVLPALPIVPREVTAGLPTVGVRMPDHPTALRLIEFVNHPLAAPSANRSGKPSPTKAQHVLDDLRGRIAGVVDGGATAIGIESTVVDVSGDPPMLLRSGAIGVEQLAAALQEKVEFWQSSIKENQEEIDPVPSPGLRYRHYAPQANLHWLDREKVQQLARYMKSNEERHGYLMHGYVEPELHEFMEKLAKEQGQKLVCLSLGSTMEDIAANLYDALRESDRLQLKHLWVTRLPEHGLGSAIVDRLQRAMQK